MPNVMRRKIFTGPSRGPSGGSARARTSISQQVCDMPSDPTRNRRKRQKTRGTPRGAASPVDYGLTNTERRRLTDAAGREFGDIAWVSVAELAEALDVSESEARRVIRAYAADTQPVETMLPHEFASDMGLHVRTLHDYGQRGLPSLGFRADKRLISPVCFDWLEQYQSLPFESGRSGWKRRRLSGLAVVRRRFGWPDDAE